MSLDPLGQRQEGFISVDVFISIVYILPAIGGLYFSWVLHLKLYISYQKLGDMCNLLGVFGPFRPRVGGLYVS